MTQKIIPNLFIIGAPKSGTTALAHNLSSHKDIYISELKEPRYFDAITFYDFEEDHPIKNLNDYLCLFDNDESVNSLYRLDASVFNMYNTDSIKKILDLSPESKFIVLLRDPVESVVSMFKQRLKYPKGGMREISMDFKECWNLLEDRKRGEGFPDECRNKFLFRYDLLYSYEKYIPNLIENIDKKNLFIGFYEDYKNDSENFYKSIFNFLNIDNVNIENRKLNESKVLKASIFLNATYLVADKTYRLRKMLGVNSTVLSKIKKYIAKSNEVQVDINTANLLSVQEYFKDTYNYLEELRKKINNKTSN